MSKDYQAAYEHSKERVRTAVNTPGFPKMVVVLFAQNMIDNAMGGEWKALRARFKFLLTLWISGRWHGFTYRVWRFYQSTIRRRSRLEIARLDDAAHTCADCGNEYEDWGEPGMQSCDDCNEYICDNCYEFHACALAVNAENV